MGIGWLELHGRWGLTGQGDMRDREMTGDSTVETEDGDWLVRVIWKPMDLAG